MSLYSNSRFKNKSVICISKIDAEIIVTNHAPNNRHCSISMINVQKPNAMLSIFVVYHLA